MTRAGNTCGVEKPGAYLEGWQLIRIDFSSHLVGFVFGHPRIPDAHLIVTSDIVDAHILPSGRVVVETLNTLYVLGQPASAGSKY